MESAHAFKANQEILEQAKLQAKAEVMAAVKRLLTPLRTDIKCVVTEMNGWLQQELSTTRRKVRL